MPKVPVKRCSLAAVILGVVGVLILGSKVVFLRYKNLFSARGRGLKKSLPSGSRWSHRIQRLKGRETVGNPGY